MTWWHHGWFQPSLRTLRGSMALTRQRSSAKTEWLELRSEKKIGRSIGFGLMYQSHGWYCWWFRNPAITTWDGAETLQNHGQKLPTSTGAGFRPPTVWVNYPKLKLTANTAPDFFFEIHRLIHGGFSSLSCWWSKFSWNHFSMMFHVSVRGTSGKNAKIYHYMYTWNLKHQCTKRLFQIGWWSKSLHGEWLLN